MTAITIDGVAIGKAVRRDVAQRVAGLRTRGIIPGLAVVLVGDDPASHAYVRNKARACGEAGIESTVVSLRADALESAVLAELDRLNADRAVHGIICQLPLPPQIDPGRVMRAIDPAKDVDGLHPLNAGKLALGDPTGFVPATPLGVQELLRRSAIETRGANVVIVGRSNLVGRPLATLLSQPGRGGDATVTLAHSRTRDLDAVCRGADILVVAIGRPGTIGAGAVRPGAAVIDVGTSRVDDAGQPRGYRLAGDVDFKLVREIAGAITPVPGGVGPLTIAMLLFNTVKAAEAAA
ncbi:MAG: bifunctional 5,10-methylenetetrahydrofolate dehydrogenase/5,10-methenyltetrahydrofolate cyclohydrolase [Gemmatimonadales bacterium]